ncbi:N-acetylmuramoyl-L-alanine amidase family protein [Clostridium botulinum]|uniref:N-acetylmuramoyl-L-alanine amidase family protein n=1 Tax=Clostridium botulinum TaxID=1491 RepID=UPI0007737EEA|nr:N-acetylmuramoyl-L-alanine amidase family protein [Clostridium botulinum]NFE95415.1 N-acetylmuramoyl-L-alanine amidase family protein [Clostridium botulinum]NFL38256.1 N-acetylmuramoyl-L-alanine amidase family protein [Clostridium botulinum]NFL64735.1 N-acetylmuramoyl-L-alanine amidase family protein [Clostridium botulinum]NFN08017.1 N-acetylmuramoyl-L-alanine amidase family protein [Clostridium botulinum]NFN24216.1 N-acetylmuramoyl-L-alanine amidase family protein [Clostridium botulinum]
MKSARLKKITAAVMALSIIASVSPVGASAAWKQDSNGWWNDKESSYSTGWENINNTWYYFNQDGYMKTGWVNDNGTWYYTDASGAMKTGWVNDGGNWYYTSQSGSMQTGWVNNNGTWYYTDNSGSMKTGWVSDNGAWYYTSSTGAMQTGVVKVDNKVYSLSQSGAMQTGNVIIEGKTYTFSESGACVSSEIPKIAKEFAPGNIDITTNQNTNNTTNNNAGTEQKNETEKVDDNTEKKSSGGKHHSSSSSDYSDVSKLNIDKQDVSFNYQVKNNAEYDVKCDLYNSNNKIVDTIKWDKADKLSGSNATIYITDVLGEMNANDYIVSQIKNNKGTILKSSKMQVVSKDKLTNEITNVSTKKENSKFNCTVQGKENFAAGTYVLYGFESDSNAYVKTVYCDGNTNTLEFKNVGYNWIKNGSGKIKLARIYDTQKVNDNSGNCKVQVSDYFNMK